MEEQLLELQKFGRIWLSTSNYCDGWHAAIDLRVVVPGMSAEIKTDFRQPDPATAVDKLHRLTMNALRQAKSELAKLEV